MASHPHCVPTCAFCWRPVEGRRSYEVEAWGSATGEVLPVDQTGRVATPRA